jgi:hypothetical protein
MIYGLKKEPNNFLGDGRFGNDAAGWVNKPLGNFWLGKRRKMWKLERLFWNFLMNE